MEKKQMRPTHVDFPSFHSFRSANMGGFFPEFPASTTSISNNSITASIIRSISHVDDAEQPITPGGSGESQVPNGGYGWIVVLGSFIAHFVFGGIERSEGIYFLEFKRRFGRTSAMTSFPGALVTALRLFVGPIAGALSSTYSVRFTCLIGSVLLFLGMLMNAFVADFELLFVSHSLLQGIGRGFLYTPSLIIVADYFDKRRGIANALSTSGTGIGTSLLAPLQQFLFNYYGYSGAFMIIAALTLHTTISSLLYKPIPFGDKVVEKAPTPTEVLYQRETNTSSSSITVSDRTAKITQTRLSTNSDPSVKISAVTIPQKSNETNEEQEQTAIGVKISDDVTIVTYHSKDPSTIYSQESCNSYENLRAQILSVSTVSTDTQTGGNRQDLFEIISKRRSLISYISMQTEKLKESGGKLRRHYSLDLLSNPPFVLFCFSITLFTAASKSIFTFIPALIISKGYSPSEAAYVLSVTGAVDILGRISAGLLFDTIQSRLIRPVICNVVIGVLAIVTFILPLLHGYTAISVTCAINSILTGAYVSQKTIISKDVLGPSNIPNSIGIFIFFQGFGVLGGIPLSGALGELKDGFNSAFFLNGMLLVASGIVMSLSNMLIRGQERASEGV